VLAFEGTDPPHEQDATVTVSELDPPLGLVQTIVALQEPLEGAEPIYTPLPLVDPPVEKLQTPVAPVIVVTEHADDDHEAYTGSPGHLVTAKLLPTKLTHKAIKKKTRANRFI
jgi:hypothetical protein